MPLPSPTSPSQNPLPFWKHLPSTLSVLYTLAILAAAWECYTLCNREQGDTFSATIRKLGQGQPFIVLITGLVCGHLFWPLIDAEPPEPTGEVD